MVYIVKAHARSSTLRADQLAACGELAATLERHDEAHAWQREAEAMRTALIDELWDDPRFTARTLVGDTWRPVPCDSLIPIMPLFLGEHLPADIRTTLVADTRRFLTGHGPATEHPESPAYRPNGYWRGPIWAPSTALLAHGLAAAGADTLARTVAERFCATCARSGFAENFDALTGAPNCDPDYTWTAAVFIVLVRRFRL